MHVARSEQRNRTAVTKFTQKYVRPSQMFTNASPSVPYPSNQCVMSGKKGALSRSGLNI